MTQGDCMQAGICACSVHQAPAARYIMRWMCVRNKVTFSLSGKQCLSAVCLILAHRRVSVGRLTFPATAITFLQAKINYGGQTQYQMKKGDDGNRMSRWAQMQRCLDLCHWISIDNHIREANGVASSIVEMFPRGKQRKCPLWQLFKKNVTLRWMRSKIQLDAPEK